MNALTLWNELFENELSGNRSLRTNNGGQEFRMTVDLVEHPEFFEINADLPGIEKKDVKVELKDGVLGISGERTHEYEKKDVQFYRKERSHGKFHRSFNLGNAVDEKKIIAEFKNGILNIRLPKKDESVSRQINIV
jgi:HSP20 family protein